MFALFYTLNSSHVRDPTHHFCLASPLPGFIGPIPWPLAPCVLGDSLFWSRGSRSHFRNPEADGIYRRWRAFIVATESTEGYFAQVNTYIYICMPGQTGISCSDLNDSNEHNMQYHAASLTTVLKGLHFPFMPETKDFFHHFVATLCVMGPNVANPSSSTVLFRCVRPPLQVTKWCKSIIQAGRRLSHP